MRLTASNDNQPLRIKSYPFLADQLQRLHSAISLKSRRTCLDCEFSTTRRHQRTEHRHQSHLWHAAVFQVEPMSCVPNKVTAPDAASPISQYSVLLVRGTGDFIRWAALEMGRIWG